jgi:hypothetical protein
MPEIEPTAELNEGFSEPGATARPWTEVTEVLSETEMFWLSTVRRDGQPHVTPLPAIWLGGALHFCAGSHEQKAKNLQANPGCVLAVGANQFRAGLDVVVEGPAAAAGGVVEVQARLGFHGHRGWVPRSGWPSGARVRRHSGEGPRVRQEPLQPDPVSLHRLSRHLTPLTAGGVHHSAWSSRVPGSSARFWILHCTEKLPSSRSPSVTNLARAKLREPPICTFAGARMGHS